VLRHLVLIVLVATKLTAGKIKSATLGRILSILVGIRIAYLTTRSRKSCVCLELIQWLQSDFWFIFSTCDCHSCDDTKCGAPPPPTPPPPTPAPPVPPPPTPPPPAPTPPNPYQNQQWIGPDATTKNTILFKGNIYKCVELDGGNTQNGTPIVINTCNNAPQQQWEYDPFKSGYIRYSADSSKCIDLIGGSTTDGNKLQVGTT
jgi:hypothetical protein